jgi:hypothetical protein
VSPNICKSGNLGHSLIFSCLKLITYDSVLPANGCLLSDACFGIQIPYYSQICHCWCTWKGLNLSNIPAWKWLLLLWFSCVPSSVHQWYVLVSDLTLFVKLNIAHCDRHCPVLTILMTRFLIQNHVNIFQLTLSNNKKFCSDCMLLVEILWSIHFWTVSVI